MNIQKGLYWVKDASCQGWYCALVATGHTGRLHLLTIADDEESLMSLKDYFDTYPKAEFRRIPAPDQCEVVR